MDLLELIETRKSTRQYSDKEISKEDLEKILKAGWLAPSWMNSQPWKFIAVRNNQTKDLLSQLSNFQPHVKNAPVVIVCVANKNAWSKEEFGEVLKKRGMNDDGIDKIFSIPLFYPPLLGDSTNLMRCLEQVTYACAFMLLEAKNLGIDSCVIGAINNIATLTKEKFEQKKELIEKVNSVLNLKEDEVIITMLTLGYDENKEETIKQRKDFNKVVFFEKA